MFHAHLRYGLTLWGGDPESIRIFRLQKKVLRIIGGTGRHASCMNLFKNLNILPLPYLYISEFVCCVKSNMEKMKYNAEVHDQCTQYMTTVQSTWPLYRVHDHCKQYMTTVNSTWPLYTVYDHCTLYMTTVHSTWPLYTVHDHCTQYMTTVHAKNQIFLINFAELHFLKTVVQMWV
jgi:hypothetical protein